MDSKLIYLVGLAGAGKTTVCKQLAKDIGAKFIQTSTEFKFFIKERGFEGIKCFHSIPEEMREMEINLFHKKFKFHKKNSHFIFLDGHMYVENSSTGELIRSMASNNLGITTGIIFLNTNARIIYDNVENDNMYSVRKRKTISIDEIMKNSEKEFHAAESYCLKENIDFGVLDNNALEVKKYTNVIYLNKYFISSCDELRRKYLDQFDFGLSPSQLRKKHYEIGSILFDVFFKKYELDQQDFQIMGVPRSGNFITAGFVSSFDGNFISDDGSIRIEKDLDYEKKLIILDSVIDTGNKISDVIGRVSKKYNKKVYVICLSINVKSLALVKSLENKAEFLCLGFSNKELRPNGKRDMGARLYGTKS